MRELTHPVIGVRAWYLYPSSQARHLEYSYPREHDISGLYSTYAPDEWCPGVNEAVCHPLHIPAGVAPKPCAHPPGPICDCGLYAYHDIDTCMRNWSGLFVGGFGIVRGWGRVQVHPDGWRAQYAEVLALLTGQPSAAGTVKFWRPRVIAELAQRFGIPTVPFNSLPAMMAEFGNPVPEDLWPLPEEDINTDRA